MRFGHPSGLVLSRFADGGLSADRREEVGAHVDQCGECRERVQFIRTLGATATELEFGRPPDVADDVLRRRQAGERVDLLAGDAPADTARAVPWTARFGIAASIALAALVGGYMLLAPTAGAHRSVLSFSPGTPTSGATVNLAYQPASYLAHHDSLRLRMRARNAESPNPRGGVIGELRVETLRKNEDGAFQGRFTLKPGDLYVAAAVEDFAGENIDSNFGQLWDVLIAEEDGEPSTAALESKYRVLEPFNWILAAEWAAEAAERYPENPFGWTMLYLHQSLAGSIPLSDSLRAFHEEKLRELAMLLDEFDAGELDWLASYARIQGRADVRERALDRLGVLAPRHRALTEQRLASIVAQTDDDIATRLERLEALWRTNGGSALLARQGLLTAAQAGHTEAVDRWIDRSRLLPDLNEASIATLLDSFDGLVSRRIQLRKDWLKEQEETGGAARPLRTSISEHRQQVSDIAEKAKMELARDLVISGDTALALSAMAEVAEKAWEPNSLRPYADILLAIGDTVAARPIVGMLYVDPIAGEEAREKYGSVFKIDASDLSRFEREYSNRVRASATSGRRLSPKMKLERLDGRVILAQDLLGRPTVLLMWDPRLPDAPSLFANFKKKSAGSRSDSIQRVVVTRTDAGGRLPGKFDEVVYDRNLELSQALGSFVMPTYLVLDSQLSPVAQSSSPATALRFAHAFLTPVY